MRLLKKIGPSTYGYVKLLSASNLYSLQVSTSHISSGFPLSLSRLEVLIQENPEAAQFRFKELQFTDILETIFNGTTVTGETEPDMQQRKSDDSVITFPMHTKEPDIAHFDEKTECRCDAVASRNGASIQKNASAVSSSEGKCNYSIGECIECLDRMEEIEQGSDLYMFALDVFLKQEYREIFLQLKTPSLRISWLQRLQSGGPPSL